MPNGKGKGLNNQGQNKSHEVIDSEGNSLSMTQAEWRGRDKNAGLTRPEEAAVVEEEAAVVEEAPVEDTTAQG